MPKNSETKPKKNKNKHTSVDEHVISAKLEEARDVLKHEWEAVVLPVIGVIRELDGSSDICNEVSC